MARKKVPQSARLSAGGVQSLFGQCPNVGGVNAKGFSLRLPLIPVCSLSANFFLFLIQTLSSRNLSHSTQNIEQDHLANLSSTIWFTIDQLEDKEAQQVQGCLPVHTHDMQHLQNNVHNDMRHNHPPRCCNCCIWNMQYAPTAPFYTWCQGASMAQADAKKHCQGHSTKFRQALPGNTSIGVKTFANLD